MLKKLLFPTDFSPSANNAFAYTLELARQLEADILLLHAYHFTQKDARFAPVDVLEALHSDRRESALQRLRAYIDEAEHKGFHRVQIHTMVKDGFAEDMIREACQQTQPDLIIMGCRGAGGVSERLIGSVTTEIMREASCPVLAIPEMARFRKIHTIAYATDFQEKSTQIAKQLSSLTQALNAQVCGVHVSPMAQPLQKVPETASSRLGELPIHYIMGEEVEQGLARFIHERLVDILAVMPLQRNFFEELFHKSLTSSLARHLDIPVLAFHERE